MCNILWLKPGAMPTDDDFENMVYNNWHGWGLILRDGNNKLEVLKDNPVENDPEELYNLIDKHRDLERFLHVRHATAGDVEMQNIHPFDVISTGKGDLYFMHNGTIAEYDPIYIQDKEHIAVREGWSDTRYYQESVLTPICSEMKDPLNIWSPGFRKIISKFWPVNNRGILITNKGAATMGTWVNRKDTQGKDYLCANDTYFDKVIRGPEFDRRESARKFAMEQARIERTSGEAGTGTNIVPFDGKQTHLRSDHFTKVYGTTQFLSSIRENPDLYNIENLCKLQNATALELLYLVEALDDDLIPWLMYVTEALGSLKTQNDELTDKMLKGARLIGAYRRLEPDLPGNLEDANKKILAKEKVLDKKVG